MSRIVPITSAFAATVCFVFQLACSDLLSIVSEVGESFTATARLSEIEEVTTSYGSGAQLVRVSSSAVDTNGKATKWSYSYLFPERNESLLHFHVAHYTVKYDSSSPLVVGTGVITHHWFDSDSAIIFAERLGGRAYRSEHAGHWISMNLGQAATPTANPIWTVTYHSTEGISKGLMIDATTGELLGQSK